MKFYTVALRGLLIILAAGVAFAYLLLYLVSVGLAEQYPVLAHFRVPLFITAVVAGVPSLVALQALWSFASLVAKGEAFSPHAVALLRRVRNCFAVTAAYLLVAYIAVTIAMQPGQSPSVGLAFVVGEIISLFLFSFAAVLVRLFDNATSLREDNSLTV